MEDRGALLEAMTQPVRLRSQIVTVAILAAIGAGLARWGYPTAIWRDGWFYLSSARSLFTSDVAEMYYWIREPIYPLILRLSSSVFGDGDTPIVFIQAGFLTGSIILVSGCLGLLRSRVGLASVAIVTFLSSITPHYFGYASKILKQPPMVVMASLAALVTFRIINQDVLRLRNFIGVVAGAFATSFVSLSVSYIWTGVALVYSFTLLRQILPSVKLASRRKTVQRSLVVLSVVLTPFLFVALSIVSGDVGREVFGQIRERYAAERAKDLTVADIGEGSVAKSLLSAPMESIEAAIQNALSLTMLGPTDNLNGVQENVVFTQSQLSEQWRCGLRDDYEPDSWTLRFIEYGDYLELSCRAAWLQDGLRSFHGLGGHFYRVQMVMLLAGLPYFAVRRKWTALAVVFPAIWFLGIYSYGVGYTNDRYGLVLFPYAAGVTAYVFRDAISLGATLARKA